MIKLLPMRAINYSFRFTTDSDYGHCFKWDTLSGNITLVLEDEILEYEYYRNIVAIVIGALIIFIGILGLVGATPIKKTVSVGFLRASVGIRNELFRQSFHYTFFGYRNNPL